MGWDIGVASMKVGERAHFTLRPEYGYGSSGIRTGKPISSVYLTKIVQPSQIQGG